jgi:hypothetical protein
MGLGLHAHHAAITAGDLSSTCPRLAPPPSPPPTFHSALIDDSHCDTSHAVPSHLLQSVLLRAWTSCSANNATLSRTRTSPAVACSVVQFMLIPEVAVVQSFASNVAKLSCPILFAAVFFVTIVTKPVAPVV